MNYTIFFLVSSSPETVDVQQLDNVWRVNNILSDNSNFNNNNNNQDLVSPIVPSITIVDGDDTLREIDDDSQKSRINDATDQPLYSQPLTNFETYLFGLLQNRSNTKESFNPEKIVTTKLVDCESTVTALNENNFLSEKKEMQNLKMENNLLNETSDISSDKLVSNNYSFENFEDIIMVQNEEESVGNDFDTNDNIRRRLDNEIVDVALLTLNDVPNLKPEQSDPDSALRQQEIEIKCQNTNGDL